MPSASITWTAPRPELAQARLDLRAVADHDPDQPVGLDRAGGVGGVGQAHAADLLGVGVEVAVVVAEAHELRERGEHGVRGLPLARQGQRQAVLRRAQLVGRDRPVAADAAQLLLQLRHRLLRLVRLHGRVGEERPLAAGVDEHRPAAVGPVLVLAQVHVDARDELPAQDAVQRLEGGLLGLALGGASCAGEDHRLLGARAGR